MSGDVVARARAALEGVSELTVYADHVCARVDKCTCDGPFETYGHRPECGLVPIAQTSDQVVSFAVAARSLVPELADRVEALQFENEALRMMLESATQQIHGEWGTGEREPFDWLPELAQQVCELKTGHEPAGRVEQPRRWVRFCSLCGALVDWELKQR